MGPWGDLSWALDAFWGHRGALLMKPVKSAYGGLFERLHYGLLGVFVEVALIDVVEVVVVDVVKIVAYDVEPTKKVLKTKRMISPNYNSYSDIRCRIFCKIVS